MVLHYSGKLKTRRGNNCSKSPILSKITFLDVFKLQSSDPRWVPPEIWNWPEIWCSIPFLVALGFIN